MVIIGKYSDGKRLQRRNIQHFKLILRIAETAAVLIIFPYAAKISGQLLRRLAGLLLSPRFVFLLGNAIVLLLFVKSSGRADDTADFYDLLIEHQKRSRSDEVAPPAPSVVRELKRSRSESGKKKRRKVPELRRSATEFTGDDEEFRRVIEEFIAKQQKTFRNEEQVMDDDCSAETAQHNNTVHNSNNVVL